MEKTIEVLSTVQFDTNFPPDNLLAFRTWLDVIIKSIPMEYIKDAEIAFFCEVGYDEHTPGIIIEYTRKATKEEKEESESNRRNRAELIKKMELKELSRIQAKYDGDVKR